jgi:peroxiredoxin
MSRTAAGLAAAAVAVAAIVAFYYFAASRPATPFAVGGPAPAFDLPAIGFEGRVRLADLRGKPIVVGILDTRWPEFLDAVEGLERLNRALRRRGLAVVGIFIDQDAEAPRAFAARYPEMTFTPASDPDGNGIAAGYGRPRSAELVVIDTSGKVVARSTDVRAWRTVAFLKTIEPLVEPEKPGS